MKRTTLIAVAAAGWVLTGCAQQPQNPSGKITKDQIQAMSGRPPTPEELKRAQESEARAMVPPAGARGSRP